MRSTAIYTIIRSTKFNDDPHLLSLDHLPIRTPKIIEMKQCSKGSVRKYFKIKKKSDSVIMR